MILSAEQVTHRMVVKSESTVNEQVKTAEKNWVISAFG